MLKTRDKLEFVFCKSQLIFLFLRHSMNKIVEILYELNVCVIILPHVHSGYQNDESLCLQLDVERWGETCCSLASIGAKSGSICTFTVWGRSVNVWPWRRFGYGRWCRVGWRWWLSCGSDKEKIGKSEWIGLVWCEWGAQIDQRAPHVWAHESLTGCRGIPSVCYHMGWKNDEGLRSLDFCLW